MPPMLMPRCLKRPRSKSSSISMRGDCLRWKSNQSRSRLLVPSIARPPFLKSMNGKRDHFLPQHYLRQFESDQPGQIAIATVDQCRLIGLGRIDRQCQKDYFYEKDEPLNI